MHPILDSFSNVNDRLTIRRHAICRVESASRRRWSSQTGVHAAKTGNKYHRGKRIYDNRIRWKFRLGMEAAAVKDAGLGRRPVESTAYVGSICAVWACRSARRDCEDIHCSWYRPHGRDNRLMVNNVSVGSV